MSVISIRSALETAINAMSPSIQTNWENVDFVPTVGTAYQKVNLLFAEPENVEFGANYRQIGILQITLFYPLKTGTNTAATRAELIRTTFKRGNSYTSGSVTVTIQRTPEIGTGSVDGDRWMIPVRVRFFANLTA